MSQEYAQQLNKAVEFGFNSNVQPKRIVKPKPVGWMCVTCDPFIVHPGYLVKCPECGSKRP